MRIWLENGRGKGNCPLIRSVRLLECPLIRGSTVYWVDWFDKLGTTRSEKNVQDTESSRYRTWDPIERVRNLFDGLSVRPMDGIPHIWCDLINLVPRATCNTFWFYWWTCYGRAIRIIIKRTKGLGSSLVIWSLKLIRQSNISPEIFDQNFPRLKLGNRSMDEVPHIWCDLVTFKLILQSKNPLTIPWKNHQKPVQVVKVITSWPTPLISDWTKEKRHWKKL